MMQAVHKLYLERSEGRKKKKEESMIHRLALPTWGDGKSDTPLIFHLKKKENMKLFIYDDKDKVGQKAAQYIADRIRQFQPTAEKPFVLGT